jgi:hypothetical protein
MELTGMEMCTIRPRGGIPCGELATKKIVKWCECGQEHEMGRGQITSFHCAAHHNDAQTLLDSLDVFRIVHRIPV